MTALPRLTMAVRLGIDDAQVHAVAAFFEETDPTAVLRQIVDAGKKGRSTADAEPAVAAGRPPALAEPGRGTRHGTSRQTQRPLPQRNAAWPDSRIRHVGAPDPGRSRAFTTAAAPPPSAPEA